MRSHLPLASSKRHAKQAALAESAAGRDLGHTRDVLTFAIGNEEYALDIENIREIIKCRPVTEVPRVPPFIAGIIAVRGVVMPVLDLRVRLRLPVTTLGPKSRILVVMQQAPAGQKTQPLEPYGLIVDRVDHVVQLYEHDIEPPTMLSGPDAEFISGIGRIQRADPADVRTSSHDPLIFAQRSILILLALDRVLAFDLGFSTAYGGSVGRSDGGSTSEGSSASKEKLLR